VALLATHSLTQVWNVNPVTGGQINSFSSLGELYLAPGYTAICGTRGGGAGGFVVVEFDPDTGEPLSFTRHIVRDPLSPQLVRLFKDTATTGTIVIAGDAGGNNVYGQQIAYDVTSGVSLTPGSLTTWTPGITVSASGGHSLACPDADTVYALVKSTTAVRTNSLDLSTGTAGTHTAYTPAQIGGGSEDRCGIFHPTGDLDGIVAAHVYVNASGATTGNTHVVNFDATITSVTDSGRGNILSDSSGLGTGRVPLGGNQNIALFTGFDANAAAPFLIDTDSIDDFTLPEFGTVASPITAVEFWQPRWGVDGQTFVRNNETGNLVHRLGRPVAGTEQGAWLFPGAHSGHSARTGCMSEDLRFFYDHIIPASNFIVYEDPDPFVEAGRQWWLGVAGWSGT
jgi:hypothetical protein